jgi:hypothetical protein
MTVFLEALARTLLVLGAFLEEVGAKGQRVVGLDVLALMAAQTVATRRLRLPWDSVRRIRSIQPPIVVVGLLEAVVLVMVVLATGKAVTQ